MMNFTGCKLYNNKLTFKKTRQSFSTFAPVRLFCTPLKKKEFIKKSSLKVHDKSFEMLISPNNLFN